MQQRQAELPVVVEPVAAGPITIMLAGVAIGIRNAAEHDTVTAIRTGRADTPSSADADTAIGITISAVAVLLMVAPTTADSTKIPSSSDARPGVTDHVDQHVGDLVGRAADLHRNRDRDHAADEQHGRPRDRRHTPAAT